MMDADWPIVKFQWKPQSALCLPGYGRQTSVSGDLRLKLNALRLQLVNSYGQILYTLELTHTSVSETRARVKRREEILMIQQYLLLPRQTVRKECRFYLHFRTQEACLACRNYVRNYLLQMSEQETLQTRTVPSPPPTMSTQSSEMPTMDLPSATWSGYPSMPSNVLPSLMMPHGVASVPVLPTPYTTIVYRDMPNTPRQRDVATQTESTDESPLSTLTLASDQTLLQQIQLIRNHPLFPQLVQRLTTLMSSHR